MVWDEVLQNLLQKGYSQVANSGKYADFLVKVSSDTDKKMSICSIVRNIKDVHFGQKQIVETTKQLERKFLLSGYSEVEVMNIIITDRQEHVEVLEEEGIKFWIVDIMTRKLMIYENQPDDYCGLKYIIERELSTNNVVYGKQVAGEDKFSIYELPFVTIFIILANIIVFIICETIASTENIDFMLEIGALNHTLVYENNEYYRLVTSIFLHFGFLHIANNMFMLGIVGVYIERWLGHIKYALIYFVSGLGGSIASLIYHMAINEDAVSAGASGAIYGIMGAMIVVVLKESGKNKKVSPNRLLFVLMLLIFGSIQENVDFAAHIGGLVIGMIATVALSAGKQHEISK